MPTMTRHLLAHLVLLLLLLLLLLSSAPGALPARADPATPSIALVVPEHAVQHAAEAFAARVYVRFAVREGDAEYFVPPVLNFTVSQDGPDGAEHYVASGSTPVDMLFSAPDGSAGAGPAQYFEIQGLVIDAAGEEAVLRFRVFDPESPNASNASYALPLWTVSAGVTIVPLVLTFVLAALTQNVVLSLSLGLYTAAIVATVYFNPLTAFKLAVDGYIVHALAEPENAAIVIFSMMCSALVSLLQRSGGARGLAEALARHAETPRLAEAATVACGILCFFDDYASTLVAGNTFRPVLDSLLVSRSMLAFIVDATAAPLASLVPISSWTSYSAGLWNDEILKLLDRPGVTTEWLAENGYETTAYLAILRSLPFQFYTILVVVLNATLIFSGSAFGPMLQHERKARFRHLFGKAAPSLETKFEEDEDEQTEPAADTPYHARNGLLPILLLIVTVLAAMSAIGAEAAEALGLSLSAEAIFGNTDAVAALLLGGVASTCFAAVLFRFQYRWEPNVPRQSAMSKVYVWRHVRAEDRGHVVPLMSFTESLEVWVDGMARLMPAIVVLVLAWALGEAMNEIGAGRFIASAVGPSVSAEALPAIVFLVAIVMGLVTGTAFAVMAIMYPLIGPLAFDTTLGRPDLYYASLCAILTGGVCGCHMSPISDTTVLASIASGCRLADHVMTQIPYAACSAIFALLFCYVPLGATGGSFGPGAAILVGAAAQTVFVLLAGAPITARKGRMDLCTFVAVQCRRRALGQSESDIEALVVKHRMRDEIERLRLSAEAAAARAQAQAQAPAGTPPDMGPASFREVGGGPAAEVPREPTLLQPKALEPVMPDYFMLVKQKSSRFLADAQKRGGNR